MRKTCPLCGRRFNLFDLFAQPLTCLKCDREGREVPKSLQEAEASKAILNIGRLITVGSIVFAGVIIFVPAREGASPSSKLYLLSMMLAIFSVGCATITAGRRHQHGGRQNLRGKKDSPTRRYRQPR